MTLTGAEEDKVMVYVVDRAEDRVAIQLTRVTFFGQYWGTFWAGFGVAFLGCHSIEDIKWPENCLILEVHTYNLFDCNLRPLLGPIFGSFLRPKNSIELPPRTLLLAVIGVLVGSVLVLAVVAGIAWRSRY